jgi:hypothetical protein
MELTIGTVVGWRPSDLIKVRAPLGHARELLNPNSPSRDRYFSLALQYVRLAASKGDIRMMTMFSRQYQRDNRQLTNGARSTTRILKGHYPREKTARPLPWRWSVLIIATLSTLVWIALMLAAIMLLKDV